METVLNASIAILLLGCLVAIAFSYHKLSSAISLQKHLSRTLADNTFAQIEALQALNTELGLRHALPPTRRWAASPDFLRNIVTHTLSNKPETVVECSSGISTIVLARCMELLGRGHVYSLEHDAIFGEKTRSLLRQHGLENYATIIDAPLKMLKLPGWNGLWYSYELMPKELAIDLLVIDGPPQAVARMARYPAVPVLWQQLNSGASIFLDDSDREDEKSAVTCWINEFPEILLLDVIRCEKGCVALTKQK